MPSDEKDVELARLRWQCRRGALELDLLFERFLDGGYQKLSRDQKDTFIKLLELDDTLLARFFNGIETPDDTAFAELVDLIRRPD